MGNERQSVYFHYSKQFLIHHCYVFYFSSYLKLHDFYLCILQKKTVYWFYQGYVGSYFKFIYLKLLNQ